MIFEGLGVHLGAKLRVLGAILPPSWRFFAVSWDSFALKLHFVAEHQVKIIDFD